MHNFKKVYMIVLNIVRFTRIATSCKSIICLTAHGCAIQANPIARGKFYIVWYHFYFNDTYRVFQKPEHIDHFFLRNHLYLFR